MPRDREIRGMLPSTERERLARPASEEPSPSEVPAAGQIIAGKYEVERVLGIGGMGIVLAARHLQLPQRVAIKFMRSEAARDPSAVERFLREARAAATLSSDHVTRVLDIGTLETGEPYMVMEYLDGVDLAQVLHQRGPMPIEEAVGSVLQACEAIAEAHSLGIVHRDLKPANLFLSKRRDGTTTIKVLDFGISKVAGFNAAASENLTASGLVMGSPGYMSPEQVRSARAVDTRTDIWALGVILYELLTGVRPFAGETLGEILALIVSETPAPTRQHRPEVPEGLSTVVAHCLERRVERRIPDVGELASRLVPYGPRDGQASVERILRWRTASFQAPASGGTQTAVADAALTPETGPAWQRSGFASTPPPASRLPKIAALAGGLTLVLGAGAYSLLARHAPAPIPSATAPVAWPSTTAAASASALLPPPPTVVAEAPTAVLTSLPDAGQPVVPVTPAPPSPAASPPKRGPKAAPSRALSAPHATPTTDEKDLY